MNVWHSNLPVGHAPDQFRIAFLVAEGEHSSLTLDGVFADCYSRWLWLHESGTYVKFTESGAQLFA